MAINFAALAEADQQIKKGGQGTSVLIKQKDITDGFIFRLTPCPPQTNGMPYFRVVQWWFGKVPIMSMETFGKPCEIQEEVDEALASDDADIRALASNEEMIKKDESYWFPGFSLKYKMEGKKLKGVAVVDKRGKVLIAGPQMANAINAVVMSPASQRIESEDAIADFNEGYNIIPTRVKTGTGQRDIKYGCTLDTFQWKVPEKYHELAVNPWELAKSFLPNKGFRRAKIRELLYGEEIPKGVIEAEEKRIADLKEEWKEKMEAMEKEEKSSAKPVVKKSVSIKEAEEVEEEIPFDADAPEVEEETPVVKAPAKKSIAPKKQEDAVDMDDDFPEIEIEKPAPKKSVPTKAAIPTKKAVAPKKVSDDLEDDEFEDT